MRNSLTKLFYPVFFLLFLLSFFLMETDYKFYLFPAWGLFLVIYSPFLKIKRFSKISFLSFLFLLLSLIASVFSHHLPLTIEKYLFYLFAFSIFIFFLKLDKKLLKVETFIEYLLLLTLVLNILVIFFSINANFRIFFQGMNLLVRSYGHNHYVAFLLLILPVLWWSLFRKKTNYLFSKKIATYLTIFLLISSYVIVLISLSRLGVLLVLAQFLCILLLNKQQFYNLRQKTFIYSLIKSLVFVFLFASLIFIFLSLPFLDNNDCFLKTYNKDFCISLKENSRFFYWRQGYLTIKNYPLVGYGLNTFKFAARRFPLPFEQQSAYAHNIFLHNLAELGLIAGGLFVFLIIYLYHQSYLKIKKSRQSLNNFLFLGASSSLFNAMFDFDWHFFVIFLLTLIFLAFILKDEQRDLPIIENKSNRSWLIYSVFLFLLSLIFLVGNLLTISWQKNNPANWLKYTPFYNSAIKSAHDEAVYTSTTYQRLYHLYRYDSDFIIRFLNLDEEIDQELKKQLYLDLAETYPATFVSKINFQEWSTNDAKILLEKFTQLVEKYHFFANDYFISYWRRQELAKQVFALGQQAYKAGDWSNASYFYEKSYEFDQYVFFAERALFLDESDLNNLVQFSLNFKKISPHFVGDFNRYIYLYREQLDMLFLENRLVEFRQLMINMLELEPQAKWYLLDHLFALAKNDEQRALLQEIENSY